MLTHPFPPVYDKNSRVLILGSFPSVQSRKNEFFYGHPQNRFWKVLAALWETSVPTTIAEKQAFLLVHHLALWDVAAACDVTGSSDQSIRSVLPNDLSPVFEAAHIAAVFTNGQTAAKLYARLQYPSTGLASVCLPSTSPANASFSLKTLCNSWRIVRTAADTEPITRR